MNIKAWIKSMRLRTIPLAVAGILLGTSQIFRAGYNQPLLCLLALFTAILLQIISNFANDYGDFVKGTDSKANRTDRMLAAGQINPNSMKNAILILSVFTFMLGLFLVYYSYLNNYLEKQDFLLILGVGILAILSAIFYTVGKKAYGYLGLGDIFVFLFFGIIPVWGLHLLSNTHFDIVSLISSIGLGLLCVGVLNTNNYRDIHTDSLNNKITIAVKLGKRKTQIYQIMLITIGAILVFFSEILYFNNNFETPKEYALLIFYFPAIYLLANHLIYFIKYEPGMRPELNNELKKLSLTILLTVVIHLILGIFI
jgi:1,4-dihydroxy-2-naphthoate octaprenyltransferase